MTNVTLSQKVTKNSVYYTDEILQTGLIVDNPAYDLDDTRIIDTKSFEKISLYLENLDATDALYYVTDDGEIRRGSTNTAATVLLHKIKDKVFKSAFDKKYIYTVQNPHNPTYGFGIYRYNKSDGQPAAPDPVAHADGHVFDIGFDHVSAFDVDDTHYWLIDGTNTLYSLTKDADLTIGVTQNLSVTANAHSAGVAAIGSDMWVGDTADRKLYGYTTSGKRKSAIDIDVSAYITDGTRTGGLLDIIALSSKIYLLTASKVYVVNSVSKARSASDEFNIPSGVATPIAFDRATTVGTSLWYFLGNDNKVYAVSTVSPFGRNTSYDFDLDPANTNPGSMTFFQSRMYIPDGTTGELYTYQTFSNPKHYDKYSSWLKLNKANKNPSGIVITGFHAYVSDSVRHSVFVYSMYDRKYTREETASLHATLSDPRLMANDGTTLYIYNYANDTIYTTPLARPGRLGIFTSNSDITNAEGMAIGDGKLLIYAGNKFLVQFVILTKAKTKPFRGNLPDIIGLGFNKTGTISVHIKETSKDTASLSDLSLADFTREAQDNTGSDIGEFDLTPGSAWALKYNLLNLFRDTKAIAIMTKSATTDASPRVQGTVTLL